MFKIAVSPTFTTPVRVELPGDNNKKITKEFTAEFKRVTQSDLDNIVERLSDKELDDDALVREVMVGWKGVQDVDGNDLEFNEGNLAALMDVHPVRPTIVKTFFATIGGSRVKN